ncbi:MAG: hypothetical protein JRJ21_06715 [Deltaproteobacteria bacterium]|nr:hypothetical protein [Deltaproteobacteria bacterium]
MRMLTVIPLSLMLFAASCAQTFKSTPGSKPSASVTKAQGLPSQGTPDSYYDFDDILVPKEMDLVPKSSLLFETPELKAGVIFFEGRVDPVSLFDFFITNMPKDNWQLRSYFKYGRYIIVFEKPDKDCIISIDEKTLTTDLEMWITPRTAK